VVGVVVVGVAVVGVAVVAVDEAPADVLAADVVDDCPDTVVGVVAVDADGLVWAVLEDEWAVPSVATRTPSPTAAADAATPMATVARRTRVTARSRARAAG